MNVSIRKKDVILYIANVKACKNKNESSHTA